MNPATLRGVIRKYIEGWRRTRVRQLERTIAACDDQLSRLFPELDDEDAVSAALLESRRQQAAFKRVNHLSKLDKEQRDRV